MKIEFPMWLVVDPTPVSELRDVVWTFEDFPQMERVLRGGDPVEARNPVLYNNAEEAEHDGLARIMGRDAAKDADWIPLADLRPGAIFETKDGVRFLKGANSKGAFCECFDLESGRRSSGDTGASLVREIKL
jgi:hypothetical protein